MQEAFVTLHQLVKAGGVAAFVVGPNRSRLGNVNTIIDTPQLLGDVAVVSGWVLEEKVPLDTYQRFEMHQQNSIREEALLLLRRP